MKPITVLIADDDATIRDGLVALLETQPDILPIGEATDGLEAVRLTGELHPDVVLMDVGMPHLNGVEATRRIKRLFPDTHVVVLTVYATHLSEALVAGANRYLLKDSCPADLMQAIRECSNRNGGFPPPAVPS